MRRIVVFTLSSLDGAVDDPSRPFPVESDGPSPPGYDAVMDAQEAKLIGRQDLILLGRNMYDEWSRYWPTVTEQPFADWINGVHKVVITSRPLDREWGEVEAVGGPLSDVVAELKARPGDGDIGVHGSITLVQSLLAEGLVDELQLAVGPVLDPQGRRLSDALPDLVRFELVESVPTTNGGLWLTYRPPPAKRH
ncbi:dihydrofolate reductase family protein [Calidifontibacter sp. DB0510]|uniref:Dihydrofolate reductase family protein n=1 Tax=Metallococcus carri TaxID=1656884 RepID=A0A967B2N7_9MICO|nr:dihydrofolate reductase family protein [Metallococcus carri]NHN57188.1 dihydrofolate reductase family protein [Metallococcus carri]NOP38009.1 hypothetical protein [Calidifontibacter sp. DB2511S]